jgi:hypothetical protein
VLEEEPLKLEEPLLEEVSLLLQEEPLMLEESMCWRILFQLSFVEPEVEPAVEVDPVGDPKFCFISFWEDDPEEDELLLLLWEP